ncbi:aromatic ring-hydroxylating dioxygenase subunit alpha [Pusillimonas sp. CC-YST705]|uniref:Aromatic ring-hydroxylating dioxygenase subunit alpha n=1 Tax=Mesopusillimonas faecipullorum TaxID=2755040 RepID=A0ABS8CEJ2_9BURK|nr:aromatic ring-hydroxylating dioxygenase subunit alpha [Mesopusillimonas faecipullorum]MCB5364433.1 aromatic ring-hydroxylating dioxygenase subunit alpha [Mesopusillimonas faecipullorum]
MPYLKNAWYMATWADEIKPGEMFHRTLLDQPIVLFRRSDGSLAALHDRCPHRFVPLHLGTLKGDAIECGYHGLQFDCSGRCVRNPHGNNIPIAARVRSYAAIEKDGIAWIWMGEADSAKVELLPDFSRLHAAAPSAKSRGYLWTDCNYKLIADNVMDLSHADFVHADSVGGGAFTRAKPKVEEHGDDVHITWECLHDSAPPAYDRLMPQPGQPVCFRTQVRWRAPGSMHLDIAITPQDAPDSEGLRTDNAHIVTPESETTTHYFYWLTRRFRTNDEEINTRRQAIMYNAFNNQDKPMLSAQQKAMNTDDLFSLSPVLLPTDAGAVRARRKLEQKIREED